MDTRLLRFYHICDPFLVLGNFELMIIVVGLYHKDLETFLGSQFSVFLYRYVVGQYGHISPKKDSIALVNTKEVFGVHVE